MSPKDLKKVLIVDDSEMVRNVHGYIIKMFGYAVGTAENGAVALEKLLSEEYHLLVTDINMPKMDGYELIRYARQNGVTIPVIVVSAEEASQTKFSGIELGTSLHMVKPTDPETLIKTIDRLLQE
jgi:two-component system chemotaxis response regulator CheY